MIDEQTMADTQTTKHDDDATVAPLPRKGKVSNRANNDEHKKPRRRLVS